MNRFTLAAILLVALFSACGNYSTAGLSEDKIAHASNASAASTPATGFESLTDAKTAYTATNTAASTAPIRRSAQKPKAQNVVQKTSLAQARVVQEAPLTIERKVIRNGDLQLESESPEDAQRKITTIAEAKGGFAVESQQSSSDDQSKKRDTVVMTVRVPADRFSDALNEIRLAADLVITETVKGEDVTEEFIDVEARIKTQKALEMQYMEIMKRANSVEDALYVQSELASVRGEIEKVEGRKRYLANQSSLSTIRIKLQTPAAFTASSGKFSGRLAESFGNGMDVALNFIFGLVAFVIGGLPFAIVFGIPGFLILRHFWRKQKRPMSVTEIAKEELDNN